MGLLAAASGQETRVTVAGVARMLSLLGDGIPDLLGDLAPVLRR